MDSLTVVLPVDMIGLFMFSSSVITFCMFTRRRGSYFKEAFHSSLFNLTYLNMIGNTPLVLLTKLSEITQCRIYAKMEYLNPGGTGKDRAVKSMLKHLLSEPRDSSITHVYEGSSGSTGISLAAIGKALGLQIHIVMPDDQSIEKRKLLESLGAQVIIVPNCSISNPQHYVNTAKRLAKENDGYFLDQFENECNWKAHYETTGPEIVQQLHVLNEDIDAFVMVIA